MSPQGKAIELDSFNQTTFNKDSTPNTQQSHVNNECNSRVDEATEQLDSGKPIMTFRNPPRNLYRVITACCWGLGAGMTDGVVGSLLPFIEAYYGINYAIVSLLWLGNALGYILIGLVGHHIDVKIGKWKSLIFGAICHIAMSAILVSGTKYPVMVVAMFFGGVGCALNLGNFNTFLPSLGAKYSGTYHGCYGVGACAGPLIATLMTDNGIQWNYFYYVLLGLTLFNLVFLTIAFKGIDEDLKTYTFENDKDDESTISSDQKQHDFKAAFKDFRTWLGCVFIFFYQGSEVSMGGWVVTFILTYRKGNPTSVGYVSSGFWAGVTIGRFLLTSPLIKYCGNRRSVIVLIGLIIGFDILTWLVPEKIAAGLFASLAGLFIGPIYPMMIVFLTNILPRKIRFCSLVLASAFGSSGGSAVPFMVGMLSQVSGTYVLHPIFLGCYAAMFFAWILMPNIERKGAIRTFWQRFW